MSTITINIDGRRINNLDQFSLDVVDPNYTGSSITVRPEFGKEGAPPANTRIDWKETLEDHVFMADLPGMKKEEVNVEVKDGMVLEIRGERRVMAIIGETWHREERSGKFFRRIKLPENANVDQVEAALENGVLTVFVPKDETKMPQVKSVEISCPLTNCPCYLSN